MKGVFVVLDGIGDDALSSLGGKTPLAAAKTPGLDALAAQSMLFQCNTLKEGTVPQSHDALLSLLGFDAQASPRGPLEAIGAGFSLKHGDLAMRANFATIDDLDNKTLLDRRAGRTLTTREAQILAKAINQKVKLPFKFEFRSTMQHRGVVVFRGGFSDMIRNVDPEYHTGGVSLGNERVHFSEALNEDEDAIMSADMLNRFVRQSHLVLDAHPINRARARKGLFSANFLLCRGPGIDAPRLSKLKGSWAGIVYTPLEIGIARAAKMDVLSFDYPTLHKIDVYANLHAGLQKAITHSINTLKRSAGKYDYFFIHFKETDIPGHDNKPKDKVAMIEALDKGFFTPLMALLEKHKARCVVTGDHSTSCRMKAHTASPVPLLYYPGERGDLREQRFTEADTKKAQKLEGKDVLAATLLS